MTAAVLIQQPDGATREVPLVAELTVLGRAPECDIALEGRLISRQHASIRRDEAGYLLQDLGSHNGTTVNGQPLLGAHVLRNGDRIELGGIGRVVFVDDDATSSRILPEGPDIVLDAGTQDAWVDGQRLDPPLSPAQFSLLQLLLDRAGQLCSRDNIAAAVWPDAHDGISDEAIDALIKRLRARLAEAPNGQRYLVTVRGRGLMLRRDTRL